MVHTVADIVGSGAAAAAITTPVAYGVRWVQFTATGTGVARVGDSNTSSSRGLAVVAGGAPVEFPWSGETSRYIPSVLFAYVPTGCTLQVLFCD